MGRAEDDTAGSRLRLLHDHFREHPRTGSAERAARPAHPGAPVNLAVVDYIAACVAEVAAETRTANPAAGPLPSRVEGAYGWWRQHTALAPAAVQQRRETVIYRQQLEQAIRLGDADVIRRHRCPACQRFSLFWQERTQTVTCTHRTCLTKSGMTRTFSLSRIAYEHVTIEKSLQDCAT